MHVNHPPKLSHPIPGMWKIVYTKLVPGAESLRTPAYFGLQDSDILILSVFFFFCQNNNKKKEILPSISLSSSSLFISFQKNELVH